jgi:L-alanine-DL-glutamate epimerase-like enolase superfamily enzyme
MRREMVLLRLRDENGLVGLGEAVPLTLRGGASLEVVEKEIGEWAAAVQLVEPPSATSPPLPPTMSKPAACAVRTALLDLECRRLDVPLRHVLGGDRDDPVPCNATLSAGEPAYAAALAADWAEDGFQTFKLKVGTARDREMVSAVRAEVGSSARIRIDANAAWSPPEAISELTALSTHGIELAEQPTAGLEGLAEVRRAVDIPIAADESVAGIEDAREAEATQACDLATIKLSKVGGLLEGKLLTSHLPVYMSSALDGPVGIAAAAHLAQALSGAGDAGVAHGLATQRLFSDTIAAVGPELRGGELHLPPGPGLGVEIDDAALERHRL